MKYIRGVGAACRVFSLHQIEGYRPPMLSGHKDMLVGVFFVGAAAASAAELDGAAAPHLLTVSRDGALFAWQFHSDQPQAQPEAGANGHSDEGAPGDDRPPKRLRLASSTNYAGAPHRLLACEAQHAPLAVSFKSWLASINLTSNTEYYMRFPYRGSDASQQLFCGSLSAWPILTSPQPGQQAIAGASRSST